MQLISTTIPEVIILEPTVFGDKRGHFFESFRQDFLEQAGINAAFVQDNQSQSKKGILRGLHFQAPPYEQGKLVRVIKGAVLDVAVDIRKSSASYGQYVAAELSEDNKRIMWVPPGFAHGFLTLADDTIFSYKCTQYYHPESESSIRWDSPSLSIDWGIEAPILSTKDQEAALFSDFKSPFK